MQAGRSRIALAILAVVATARTGVAAPSLTPRTSPVPSPVAASPTAKAAIAPARAGQHVGEDVTIEGEVFAIHASPTATVLAFAPNFAGFTATILAADRAKFPPDIEQQYRNRVARLTGTVTTYRGKPEMALRDPSQITLVERSGSQTPGIRASAVPLALATPAADSVADVRDDLAGVSERLDGIEARLAAIERSLAALATSLAEPRTPSLAIGTPAATVRAAFGEPLRVARGARGEAVWVYDGDRSVTFDATGRVLSWTGF